MYELKTKLTDESVREFIDSIEDIKRRDDSNKLMDLISEIVSDEPKMWGTSIIGYGEIEYTNSTKKKYKWFKLGFSPRKSSISLYLTAYSDYIYEIAKELNLKHGKGCFYIKNMDSIDKNRLRDMIIYTVNKSASQ